MHGLDRAIRRAEGIGLVVGPPGTGKSLLLAKVAESVRDDFDVAMLSGARICTRRALWQAILAEIGEPYRGIEEGELRIGVVERIRGLAAAGSGLVVLVEFLLQMELMAEQLPCCHFLQLVVKVRQLQLVVWVEHQMVLLVEMQIHQLEPMVVLVQQLQLSGHSSRKVQLVVVVVVHKLQETPVVAVQESEGLLVVVAAVPEARDQLLTGPPTQAEALAGYLRTPLPVVVDLEL